MFDKTIIGGVDDSQEGAWAAALSWELAKRAGVPCRIVHVASEISAPAPMLPPEVDFEGLVAHVQAFESVVHHAIAVEIDLLPVGESCDAVALKPVEGRYCSVDRNFVCLDLAGGLS